jgi:hypothetical protein
MIDGIEIQYTIETKDIFAVLGSVYIYRPVTFLDTIRIIYRGLQRNCGYSYDEFQAAVMKGNIYPSKRGCVIIDYGHLWCTLLLYIV